MSELISRNAILKNIEKIRHDAQMMDDIHRKSIVMNGMSLGEKAVMNQPSVQLQRMRGRWIYNSPVTMKCDQCGIVIKDWDWFRFKICPGCGAKMVEPQESEVSE